MRSLPVNSKNYFYYFEASIKNTNIDDDIYYINSPNVLNSFVKVTLCVVGSFIIGISWILVIIYLYANNWDVCFNDKSWKISYNIFSVFISITILILTIMAINVYKKNHTLHVLIEIKDVGLIVLLVCIFLICMGVLVLPMFLYHLNIWEINWMDIDMCKYMEFSSLNSLYVYNRIIVPGVLPFVFTVLFYGMLRIHKMCCPNKNNWVSRMDTSTLKRLHTSVQYALISDDGNDYDGYTDSNLGSHKSKPLQTTILLLISYPLSIIILNLISYMNFKYKEPYIIVIFYCGVFCVKLMMKKIGRMVDFERLNNSDFEFYISFEYLMEWSFCVYYWSWIRYYILFSDLELSSYITLISIHFISEILETNIKYLRIYFNTITDIINSLKYKYYGKYIYRMFKDNSNIVQWHRRISLDNILRFYASLLSGIFTFLILIKHNNNKSQILITIIFIFIEWIYYIISFYITYKMIHFNILQPYILWIQNMSYSHMISLLCIFFSFFVAFWFL